MKQPEASLIPTLQPCKPAYSGLLSPEGAGLPGVRSCLGERNGLACRYLGISVSVHTSVHSGLKPEGCVPRFKRDRSRCDEKSWRQHGFHSRRLLDKYSHTHPVFLIFSFLAALDQPHLGSVTAWRNPNAFSSGDQCSEIEMKRASRWDENKHWNSPLPVTLYQNTKARAEA